jgi:hypothetical protein
LLASGQHFGEDDTDHKAKRFRAALYESYLLQVLQGFPAD